MCIADAPVRRQVERSLAELGVGYDVTPPDSLTRAPRHGIVCVDGAALPACVGRDQPIILVCSGAKVTVTDRALLRLTNQVAVMLDGTEATAKVLLGALITAGTGTVFVVAAGPELAAVPGDTPLPSAARRPGALVLT